MRRLGSPARTDARTANTDSSRMAEPASSSVSRRSTSMLTPLGRRPRTAVLRCGPSGTGNGRECPTLSYAKGFGQTCVRPPPGHRGLGWRAEVVIDVGNGSPSAVLETEGLQEAMGFPAGLGELVGGVGADGDAAAGAQLVLAAAAD